MVAPLRSPQQPTPALRERVSLFKLDPGQLDSLRHGFAAIKGLRDNRGFWYWAGLHGAPGYDCEHSTRQFDSLFLPWHRAYLYHLELALQTQAADATLPWWDWPNSRTVGIPPAFADAPAGQPDNPLAGGSIPQLANDPAGWPSQTSRNPGNPVDLPDQTTVDDILALSDFNDFSIQLEQQLHNQVHGWVGGTMGVIATSAYDPIFWVHHTMVDRLWALWQVKHASPGPAPQTWSTPLRAVSMTIGDVLSIQRLGYDYAGSVTTVAPGA